MPGIENVGTQTCEMDPSSSMGPVEVASTPEPSSEVCVEPHPASSDPERQSVGAQVTRLLDDVVEKVPPGGKFDFQAQLRVGDPAVVVNAQFGVERARDGKGLSVSVGAGVGVGLTAEAGAHAGLQGNATVDGRAVFHFDDSQEMTRVMGRGVQQTLDQGLPLTPKGFSDAALRAGDGAGALFDHLEKVTLGVNVEGKGNGAIPLGASEFEVHGHAVLKDSLTVGSDGSVVREQQIAADQNAGLAAGVSAAVAKGVVTHSGTEVAFGVTFKVSQTYHPPPGLAGKLLHGEVSAAEALKAMTQGKVDLPVYTAEAKGQFGELEITGTKTLQRPDGSTPGIDGMKFKVAVVNETTLKASVHADVVSGFTMGRYRAPTDEKELTLPEVGALIFKHARAPNADDLRHVRGWFTDRK